jgi:hypothetical protein
VEFLGELSLQKNILLYDLIYRSGKSSFLKEFVQYLSDHCSDEVYIVESISYDEVGHKV